MNSDDVLGVFFVVLFAAGWIAALIYFGFWWSLAYLVAAFALYVVGLRWAIKHEQREMEGRRA